MKNTHAPDPRPGRLAAGVGSMASLLGLCAVSLGVAGPAASQSEDLERLLAAVHAYVDRFDAEVGGLVCTEEYRQYDDRATHTRRLRSHLLMVSMPVVGWASFRDTLEVDGEQVRDREDRLSRLFLAPSADSIEQARRIAQEGARFNLNPSGVVVDRTINNPMLPLRFLGRSHRARSAFRMGGSARIKGTATRILRFEETASPRIIRSPDQAAATGAFWIEPSTGAVVAAELRLLTTAREGTRSIVVDSMVRVQYAAHKALGFHVPSRMAERYRITLGRPGARTSVDGEATYRDYRKFNVTVESEIRR